MPGAILVAEAEFPIVFLRRRGCILPKYAPAISVRFSCGNRTRRGNQDFRDKELITAVTNEALPTFLEFRGGQPINNRKYRRNRRFLENVE